MSTIGTTITAGITLGTADLFPTYASPLTITSTGAVGNTYGNAVYGPFTQAWTVVNYGTIIGSDAGVWLTAGGSVSNSSTAGLIAATGRGGVYAESAAGTVSNSGTILNTGSLGFDAGVKFAAGGSVGNAGLIMGGGHGIVAIWEMNGFSVAASGLAGAVDPASWTSGAPATSTATAGPTSCGRTPAATSRSGR